MSKVQLVQSAMVQVDGIVSLDQVMKMFPGFTREGESEVIVEVATLRDQNLFGAMMGFLKDNGVDTGDLEGVEYIHCWV